MPGVYWRGVSSDESQPTKSPISQSLNQSINQLMNYSIRQSIENSSFIFLGGGKGHRREKERATHRTRFCLNSFFAAPGVIIPPLTIGNGKTLPNTLKINTQTHAHSTHANNANNAHNAHRMFGATWARGGLRSWILTGWRPEPGRSRRQPRSSSAGRSCSSKHRPTHSPDCELAASAVLHLPPPPSCQESCCC